MAVMGLGIKQGKTITVTMKLPGTIGEGRSGQFFVLCNKKGQQHAR